MKTRKGAASLTVNIKTRLNPCGPGRHTEPVTPRESTRSATPADRALQLFRLAAFVGVFLVLQEGSRRLLRQIHVRQLLAGHSEAWYLLIIDALRFACVLFAMLSVSLIEKKPTSVYGLPKRGMFGRQFLEGMGWGFVAESATILILRATGNVTFQGVDQHGWPALWFALLWGATFVAAGLFEESLFRGYPQFALGTVIGFWPAAIVLSALFWWQHMANIGETWIGGFDTALAGLTFCLALRRTGSLWFPIGLHAGWDWAETYFYGVADSGMPASGHLLSSALHGPAWMTGGTAGPEASVIDLVVTAALMLLIAKRFRLSALPSFRKSGKQAHLAD